MRQQMTDIEAPLATAHHAGLANSVINVTADSGSGEVLSSGAKAQVCISLRETRSLEL